METIRILKRMGDTGLIESLPLDGLKLYILFLLFVRKTETWSAIDFMTIKRALGGILSLRKLEKAIASLERYHLTEVIYPWDKNYPSDKKRFLLKSNTNFFIKYILYTPSYGEEKRGGRRGGGYER